MKKRLSNAHATYGPQKYKTFAGALAAFLQKECPQVGGDLIRMVLVRSIVEMVNKFHPETSHLRPGQTQWVTVDRDENPSYGKKMKDTRLTSVVLDLVRPKDTEDFMEERNLREIKKEAVSRLFQQAYDQGVSAPV